MVSGCARSTLPQRASLQLQRQRSFNSLTRAEAWGANSAFDIGGNEDIEVMDALCRGVFRVRHDERHGAAPDRLLRERDRAENDLHVDR
jgi:hypothetical protein